MPRCVRAVPVISSATTGRLGSLVRISARCEKRPPQLPRLGSDSDDAFSAGRYRSLRQLAHRTFARRLSSIEHEWADSLVANDELVRHLFGGTDKPEIVFCFVDNQSRVAFRHELRVAAGLRRRGGKRSQSAQRCRYGKRADPDSEPLQRFRRDHDGLTWMVEQRQQMGGLAPHRPASPGTSWRPGPWGVVLPGGRKTPGPERARFHSKSAVFPTSPVRNTPLKMSLGWSSTVSSA